MKKLYVLILLMFQLSFMFSCHAQVESIDSLKKLLVMQKEDTTKVNLLNALSIASLRNRESALQFAQQAIKLSQKLGFKNGEGKAYYQYGTALFGSNYYGKQGSLREVLKNFNAAIKIYKATRNEAGIADCYFKIGKVYYGVDQNISEALKYFYEALKIYELVGIKKGTADCLFQISVSYESNTKFIYRALKIYEELKDTISIADVRTFLGDIYLSEGKADKSLEAYFSVLKIYQHLGSRGPDFGIPYTFGNIGEVYSWQGKLLQEAGKNTNAQKKLEKALEYFNMRLQLEQQGKMSPRITYLQLGDCLFRMSKLNTGKARIKKLRDSRTNYQRAIDISKEKNQKGLMMGGYESLNKVDTALGDYKNAYRNYNLYILYRDSIYNEKTIRKTTQTEMQYEYDKKSAVVKAKQQQKDAEALRAKYLMLITLFSVAVISLLLFNRYRSKKKTETNRALMNERLRISGELHDEVGATLSGIAMYSHLTKEQIKTANTIEVEKSLNIMQQSASEMVNKLNDIVWLTRTMCSNFLGRKKAG